MTHDIDAGGVIEPLAESAPVAWAIAPQLCPGDPASPDACVWYHRIWQYLRLLDVITSIRTNTAFLIRTFDELAADHPRVLVSGTADYAMLAHLKQAYGGRTLDVTVVDRCPTSLYLNRWYADRFAIRVNTVCSDVLDYTTDRPFDLICTHNFVSRFEATSRRRLIARWHALLRPGGVVITTQRIRPHSRDVKSFYTPQLARELSDRVVRAAAGYGGALGADLEELALVAYEYAMRKGAYVIRSLHEITGAFESEGFDVERVDEGAGAAEREYDRPSSNAGMDTYRMRIVARKAETKLEVKTSK